MDEIIITQESIPFSIKKLLIKSARLHKMVFRRSPPGIKDKRVDVGLFCETGWTLNSPNNLPIDDQVDEYFRSRGATSHVCMVKESERASLLEFIELCEDAFCPDI